MARIFSVDTRVSPLRCLLGGGGQRGRTTLRSPATRGQGASRTSWVRGEYRMRGQKVVVTITDKHWLLPWPVVEVRMRELLASA